MKLIQARIRGLGTTMETRWFDLSPQLNLFHFPEKVSGENFLRTLQTINPPYSCQTVKPFAAFPSFLQQGQHIKHIIGAKRTVSLAVFAATPGLVKELAAISPLLYEVDRIETGRRLDYSRWINFVELASSTRWCEIASDMLQLLDQCHEHAAPQTAPLEKIINTLQPSDRIKNHLQHQLTSWLKNISPFLNESSQQLIETTLTMICRTDHFEAARAVVSDRLPFFVFLDVKQQPKNNFNHTSIARSDLMHLAKTRSRLHPSKSTDYELTFMDEINNQLTNLKFSGLTLQFEKKGQDVSLKFCGSQGTCSGQEPLAPLRHLQADACLAVALSRVVCGSDPILLFNGADHHLPEKLRRELAEFVMDISKTCQCLYTYNHASIFPEKTEGRSYRAAELTANKNKKAGKSTMTNS